MTRPAPLEIHPGDTLVLKKAHPCGSQEWRVLRLGIDIRLSCLGCSRMMMMPRSELGRKLKSIRRSEEGAAT